MKGKSLLFVALLAGGPGAAQELALPFPAGDLGANQQNQPAAVVAEGDRALIGRRGPNGISVAAYRRDGAGTWQFEDTLDTGAIRDMTLNPAVPEAAILIGGEVRFHRPFFAPDWNFVGSAQGITLPAGEAAVRVELDGDVAAVLTQESGIGSGHRVRIHERSGGSWSEVAMLEFPTSGPFPGNSTISDLALQGTRLVLGLPSRRELRVHERDQGGPANWGEIRVIDGGMADEFGAAVVLDGDRLATVARDDPGTPRIEVFGRDAGGPDQWGGLGTAFSAPERIAGLLVDADDGRLVVLGLPAGGESPFPEGLGEAWWFAPGGPTGWVEERRRDLGAVRGISGFLFGSEAPRWAAITGDDALFGLADEEYDGGAAAWAVSAHRRSLGGAAGWGLAQVIDGNGVADGFGRSIAFHGGVLAVGMPDDSWSGGGTGSVMLWLMYATGRGDGQTLLPLARLESPSPQAGELFGLSVAVHASGGSAGIPDEILVAVGAPGRDGGRGAAYVFDVSIAGAGAAKVLTPAAALDVNDTFGRSVAVRGDAEKSMVAVGAPGDDDGAADAGAVYLFERDLGGVDQWGQRAKRGRPAGISGTAFGRKVALAAPSSERFLLATRPPVPGTPGQIGVFRRAEGGTDGWGLDEEIDPPPGSPPGFAAGLASDSTLAGVGATGGTGGTGKAYIYGWIGGAWTPALEVSGSAADGPSFGEEIAVSQLHMAVGAPDAAGGDGRLAVFSRPAAGPGDLALMFTRAGGPGENLGRAVGSFGIYSAAGAPGSNTWGPGGGRVIMDRAGSYEIWAKARGPAMIPRWRPDQDADDDGQRNLIEFALGSDPTDAGSRGLFQLERGIYRPTSDADPAMVWQEPGLPYDHALLDWRVDASSDLILWNLERYRPGGSLGSGERFYLLPVPDGGRRFYRLDPYYPWFAAPQGQEGGGIIIID